MPKKFALAQKSPSCTIFSLKFILNWDKMLPLTSRLESESHLERLKGLGTIFTGEKKISNFSCRFSKRKWKQNKLEACSCNFLLLPAFEIGNFGEICNCWCFVMVKLVKDGWEGPGLISRHLGSAWKSDSLFWPCLANQQMSLDRPDVCLKFR